MSQSYFIILNLLMFSAVFKLKLKYNLDRGMPINYDRKQMNTANPVTTHKLDYL